MRAKLEGTSLTQKKVLYKAGPNTTGGQHFGSRIAFDNKGYLYFSIGERGQRDINPKTAIYSYGHRNPQGLVKHYETGAIWNHEHGPRGGDEINIIKAGANYGWPAITYGINYSGTSITDKKKMKGMEQPIHYWTPSIAPSGMVFISSDKYADWKGSLLVGSLSFQYLERLQMNGTKVIKREKLMPNLGRVRNVKEGPDGLIYVAIEGKGIYKLIPKK